MPRTDAIRLVGGSLTYRDEWVGPKHDPYGRKTIQRYWGDDVQWKLVSCGLAGEWLEVEGKRVAELPTYGVSKEDERAYAKKVEEITGFTPFFWLDKVWALRLAHMSQEQHDMREADERLLRYAM